jgi:hypothetical protein
MTYCFDGFYIPQMLSQDVFDLPLGQKILMENLERATRIFWESLVQISVRKERWSDVPSDNKDRVWKDTIKVYITFLV